MKNKNHLLKGSTKSSMIPSFLKNPLFLSTIFCAGVSSVYILNNAEQQTGNDMWPEIKTVEKNIEKTYEFHDFKLHSFSPHKNEEQYLIKVSGAITKYKNQPATIAYFSYEVNPTVYEFMTGDSSNNTQFSSVNKMKIVLAELIELTTQKAFKFEQETLPTPGSTLPVLPFEENEFEVLNITTPQINSEKNMVYFNISAIIKNAPDENDEQTIRLNTYQVCFPLQKELKNNPYEIYQYYVDGKTEFKKMSEKTLKVKNFDYISLNKNAPKNENSFEL